tara:strand:+ start:378 stop:689 length:312 start_codon:yes stop_codon:yes gene_type:complete
MIRFIKHNQRGTMKRINKKDNEIELIKEIERLNKKINFFEKLEEGLNKKIDYLEELDKKNFLQIIKLQRVINNYETNYIKLSENQEVVSLVIKNNKNKEASNE